MDLKISVLCFILSVYHYFVTNPFGVKDSSVLILTYFVATGNFPFAGIQSNVGLGSSDRYWGRVDLYPGRPGKVYWP